MATGDQLKYSTDETEQTKYVCCSLCLEDGNRTSARHYCVDCEMYYCGKCVKYHNKIPTSKSHHVNDIESSDSNNMDEETKRRGDMTTAETPMCTIHHGKLKDTYCKDHDEMCCGTCAMVKHRPCSIESIHEAAKDFKSNPEVNKSKEALTKVLTKLKQVKQERTENINCIGRQKLESIKAVDKYEDKIIKKVKELANISRQEIRSKYEEQKTALDVDVQVLDAAMTTSTTYVDKLSQTSNEQELFTTVRTSKIVTRDGESLLQSMLKEWTHRELIFHFDKTFENTFDGLKALGMLEDDCTVNEYMATLQSNVNIKQRNESNTNVYDMCFMDSGGLLLSDYNNKKLRRFTSDLQLKDDILLPGYPLAVFKIDQHEVAVRINVSNVVQFVSVGQSMRLTSSFKLAGHGIGMTYDAGTGEIFACEVNKVNVYNKTGNKLRTYDKDANGEPMFSDCRQIALSENENDIYVTDTNTGLTILDKSGHLKMKVSLSGLNDVMPLCVLPGHIFLTGSQKSGTIVQVDKDGKQIGTLTVANDGRTENYCIMYDHEHSKLFVGGNTNVISVYTLSPK